MGKMRIFHYLKITTAVAQPWKTRTVYKKIEPDGERFYSYTYLVQLGLMVSEMAF